MSWTAAVASTETFTLGEGPFWDAPRKRLLWVDVDAGTVHEGRLDGDLITTATAMLDAAQLAAHPMSGRLFLADVGVAGLPVTPWAGPLKSGES